MCLCTYCTVPTLVSHPGTFTPSPPHPLGCHRASSALLMHVDLNICLIYLPRSDCMFTTPPHCSPSLPRLLSSTLGAFYPSRWILLGSFFCSYKNFSKPFRFKVNSESSKPGDLRVNLGNSVLSNCFNKAAPIVPGTVDVGVGKIWRGAPRIRQFLVLSGAPVAKQPELQAGQAESGVEAATGKKHMYFAIQWFLPDLSPGQPWQIAQCPLHHQTCDDSPPSSTHTLHAFRLPHCMICAELCTPHGRDGLSLHTNQVVIATPCRPWASISSQVIHWFLASLSGLPGTISEKYFTWVSSSSFYPSYYFLSKLFPVEFL